MCIVCQQHVSTPEANLSKLQNLVHPLKFGTAQALEHVWTCISEEWVDSTATGSRGQHVFFDPGRFSHTLLHMHMLKYCFCSVAHTAGLIPTLFSRVICRKLSCVHWQVGARSTPCSGWYGLWSHDHMHKDNLMALHYCVAVHNQGNGGRGGRMANILLTPQIQCRVYPICVAHAWHIVPTLLVTPAQLMRPAIGQNVTCTCLTSGPEGCSQPKELWFLIYSCTAGLLGMFSSCLLVHYTCKCEWVASTRARQTQQ